MQRVLLQRCVLAFVLLLGGSAILSSLSSCRVNDILNPVDTTSGGNGGGNNGGGNNGGRDTTTSRDSNVTTDTTNTIDTTRSIVINGGFDKRGATGTTLPAPWKDWWTGTFQAEWASENGCGSGAGSIRIPMAGGVGIWETLGSPMVMGQFYQMSICASAATDRNGVCEPAEIHVFGSSDDGMTAEEIGKFYTNSPGWGQQSLSIISPNTYTSIWLEVEPFSRTQTAGFTSIDNFSIVGR